MPNRNYVNGRAREYRIMSGLKKAGYDEVLRMSGSKGFCDIVAINKKAKVIRFIQVKPKSLGVKAIDRILQEHSWIKDEYLCTFEVISSIGKLGIKPGDILQFISNTKEVN